MQLDLAQSPIANRKSQILLWAAYLGASWTWCIGMYLPVLLVRDYGVWGWVVFAVPNVIGAAAMGWVLRSPEQSARITAAHQRACRAFSLATIAFQVYFAGWFVRANSPLAAVGSAALLQTSSGNFLVAHTAQSTFSALSSICTHEVCTINGWSSQSFVCPCHGSTFDTSGHVARGPAPSSLRQYPAQFVDGVLTITA